MEHAAHGGTDPGGGAPLILIVDGERWPARALESLLLPAGLRVHRAHSAAQGWRAAVLQQPDALLIDLGPGASGIELCRRLSAEPRIGPATPLILTTSDPDARRQHRTEALRSGAWEFLLLPAAIDELLARLNTWVRAKRAVDRAREESLLDFETGFYNARGLHQRATELVSDAVRFRRPLSCVVFTLDAPRLRPGRSGQEPRLLEQVRAALLATVRTCDAVGRLTFQQFAVLAPATDPAGAQRLAQRVLAAVDLGVQRGGGSIEPAVFAGYFGVPDLSEALLEPGDLLDRAASADRATADPLDLRIRVHASAAPF